MRALSRLRFYLIFILVLGIIMTGLGGKVSSDDGTGRRIQADDPLVSRNGNWNIEQSSQTASGYYLYSSGNAGDALTLEFQGTSVEIIYVQHPSLGTMGIEIDGTVVRSVITTSEETIYGASQVVSYLDDKPHTLRIIAVQGIIAVETIIANPYIASVDPLMAEAQANGSVGVIVELNTGFQAEGFLPNGQAVSVQRQTIRSAQTQLLNSLASYAPQSVRTYEFIPFVAMRINAQGLQALRSDPAVKSVTRNEIRHTDLGFSTPLIGATTAWSSGYDGTGYVVAVVDTGVDRAHRFLGGTSSAVVAEACFSDGEVYPNSLTTCPNLATSQIGTGAASPTRCNTLVGASLSDCDHGTHVAGIAAGRDPITAPATGFSGVAKGAQIIGVQVFTVFTSLSDCNNNPIITPCVGAWDSDVLAGLNFVYGLTTTGGGSMNNIASLNMSLGGGQFFSVSACDAAVPAYVAAANNLVSANVAVIASSGNNGYKNAMGSPACASNILSVGATTTNRPPNTPDLVANFSNSATFLDFLAPGVDIQSSIPGTNTYAIYDGTSMASPHVAGAWAVLRQRYPAYTVAQITQLLTDTAVMVTDSANGLTDPRINLAPIFSAPTLVSPISNAAVYTSRPIFQFSELPGATWYHIVATTPSGGNLDTWQQVGVGVTCTSGTCSLKAPTDVGPVVSTVTTTVTWTAQAYNGAILGVSSPATYQLGVVQNPSPSGIISLVPEASNNQQGRPVFSWNKTANATETYYYLFVERVGSGQVYSLWIPVAGNCSGSACSFQPTTALTNGAHRYYIRAWGPDGYGPWRGPQSFTLSVTALPAAITGRSITPHADGSVTFQWTEDTNASGYNLVLVGPAGSTPGSVLGTVGNEVTCAAGTCSRTVPLSTNGNWAWYLAGFNAGGTGPWSPLGPGDNYGRMNFVLNAVGVAAVTKTAPLAGPLTSGLVQFTWVHDANASAYEVYLVGPGGFVDYHQWSAATYCTGGNCAITILVPSNGSYTWYLRGVGNLGAGPWSPLNGPGDNYGAVIFNVNAPAITTAITKNSPTQGQNVTTTAIQLTWTHNPNATSYAVFLSGPGGFVHFVEYVVGQGVTCAANCTITIHVTAEGTYSWYMRGRSAAGYGPWGPNDAGGDFGLRTFGVDVAAPAANPTLVLPANNAIISNGASTVTFQWNAVNNATWYALVLVNRNTGAVISTTWYSAANAGCASGTCEVAPVVASGSYRWAVLTYGPGSSGAPTYVPGVTPTFSFDKL